MFAFLTVLSAEKFPFGTKGWQAKPDGVGYASEVNAYGFAGGDGSEESPFLIETAEQLDNVRNYLYNDEEFDELGFYGYYFKLIADIDLNGYADPVLGWEPIGTFDGFIGTFDGGGHTISGLWVNRIGDYTGLFGRAAYSSFYDINIVTGGDGVKGTYCVGGLAGVILGVDGRKSEITRCSVSGKVSLVNSEEPGHPMFPSSACGGIVGYIEDITIISKSYFKGVLSDCPDADYGWDGDAIGGIAGLAKNGVITNCYADVEIVLDENKPSRFAAGILGMSMENIEVSYCFAAPVSQYAVAPVIAGMDKTPIAGGFYSTGIFYNYYCSDMLTAATEIGGVTGLTAEQMKDAASYVGWNFKSIWGFGEDGNLVLRDFGKAYDPPVKHPPLSAPENPRDPLKWLWIMLPCVVLGAAVLAAAFVYIYKRKKPVFVTERVEVEKEVIKEVPISEGKPLPLGIFTPAEKRVAELLLLGKSRREIAAELSLAENTVRNHTSSILDKAESDSQKAFIAKYMYDKKYFE